MVQNKRPFHHPKRGVAVRHPPAKRRCCRCPRAPFHPYTHFEWRPFGRFLSIPYFLLFLFFWRQHSFLPKSCVCAYASGVEFDRRTISWKLADGRKRVTFLAETGAKEIEAKGVHAMDRRRRHNSSAPKFQKAKFLRNNDDWTGFCLVMAHSHLSRKSDSFVSSIDFPAKKRNHQMTQFSL